MRRAQRSHATSHSAAVLLKQLQPVQHGGAPCCGGHLATPWEGDGEGDTVRERRRGRHRGRETVRETQWERDGEGDTVGGRR